MTRPVLQENLMGTGNLACPGCGASLAMRYALEALGPRTMVVVPAGCWSTFVGIYPYTCLAVPTMSVAFETAASTAGGVKAGLEAQGVADVTVMAWAGDGGTFDIGFQALSGAAERNDDILYVCYDNEAYMNTGIQRSSATPRGCWTTTTPAAAVKPQPKKDMVAIMAAHGVPYAATASIGFPHDFMAKLKKAKDIGGTRFIHLFASCPTGWRHETHLAVEIAQKAVASRVFPLYEVTDGEDWRLSEMPPPEPVDDYLGMQGRFKAGLAAGGAAGFQAEVDRRWRRLAARCRRRGGG
jgi:pyruvate ferredoxin oxidoreductase beta subunit/2-oxoisovalerate ferredoxin oxidoreductase beta subunit